VSRWPEHETVDWFQRLDVRALARAPGFPPGGWSEARAEGSSWSLAGNLVVEVVAAGEGTGLLLTQGSRSYGVVLELEPCHLGGVRPWFRCPASGCDRRCATLYLRGELFACRKCQGLTYPSQREDPAVRAFRRRDRILTRAGCEAGPVALATRPPRMWWSTFERLRTRAQCAEDEALALMLSSLGG